MLNWCSRHKLLFTAFAKGKFMASECVLVEAKTAFSFSSLMWNQTLVISTSFAKPHNTKIHTQKKTGLVNLNKKKSFESLH